MDLSQVAENLVSLGQFLEDRDLAAEAIAAYRTCVDVVINAKYRTGVQTQKLKMAELKVDEGDKLMDEKAFAAAINNFKLAIDLMMTDTEEVKTKRAEIFKMSANKKSYTDNKNDEQAMELPKPFVSDNPVTYDDICGFTEAKEIMDEIFFHSVMLPEYAAAVDARKSPGILFFGPPGVGKTYFISAVASQHNIPLFVMNPSSLKSKWYGETEKMIGSYLQAAKEAAAQSDSKKAIICIDEADSFLSHRKIGSESDTQNEILMAMHGLNSSSSVVWVALTNFPFSLDKGFLSRFKTKIYVSLPDAETRMLTLQQGFSRQKLNLDEPLSRELVKATERFTCRELANFIEAAGSIRLRKITSATHWKEVTGPKGLCWEIAASGDPGAIACKYRSIDYTKISSVYATNDDIKMVLKQFCATTEEKDLQLYRDFNKKHNGIETRPDTVALPPLGFWGCLGQCVGLCL